MLHTKIAIAATSEKLLAKAQTLAVTTGLPITEFDDQNFSYFLVITEQQLEIRATKTKFKPITINFHPQQNSNKPLIAKACGIKKGGSLKILDATAGLGEDAFTLVTLGAKVHMLERSPIIGALLQESLERLNSKIAANLSLTITDAISYLENPSDVHKPDVIYLDPMYPQHGKSALNKKEMRVLRDLVGDDEDASKLFTLALKYTAKRVVVKRQRLAPPITNLKPDIIFKGKCVRFDVYLKKFQVTPPTAATSRDGVSQGENRDSPLGLLL